MVENVVIFFMFREINLANIIEQGLFDINGLIQERHNSIANALELRISCTNPSMLSGCWELLL